MLFCDFEFFYSVYYSSHKLASNTPFIFKSVQETRVVVEKKFWREEVEGLYIYKEKRNVHTNTCSNKESFTSLHKKFLMQTKI